jgi:glycolate oxidase
MDTLGHLVASLPHGVVAVDPTTTEKYRFDSTRHDAAGHPLAVVRAEDAEQVQTAVRWAAAHHVPIVPRGAGTGLAGGASAVDGGLVISLDRMRAIEIDSHAQVAVAEAGAFNAEVKRAAADAGLWYPPDPSSFEISSIGGNVATNAGGLCCVKYGVTSDYVLGLDVVLADGVLVRLGGKSIKDVAGLPLTKLFVGSEGTLGIVAKVILRLLPAPGSLSTLVATFPTVVAAAEAVVGVRRRIRPSMMELMDRRSLNAVEDFQPMGLDRSAGALLVAQSDAPGAARADEVAVMEEICATAGASDVFVTDVAGEGELFVAARRACLPALEQLGALLLEDVGVPVPMLPGLLTEVEAIARRHDVDIAVVAHAGDGNAHPIIVCPPGDPTVGARAALAVDEVMTAAIRLGGTITGEHGVGRDKTHKLLEQLGPDVMDLTRRLKDALDPDGILNPGVILPAR